MKFLKEIVESVKSEIITEAETGKKSYYVRGVFMQGNIPNRNGRVYPTETLIKEANRFKKESIDAKRSLGELNHPESVSINPERASHLITNLWVEGNNIMGEALVLDTPMGKIVKSLLEAGVQLGISSRGFGSLSEVNGVNQVGEDYHLSTLDLVSDPSGPDCFPTGIFESKEFILESGQIKEIQPKVEVKKLDEKALLAGFSKMLGETKLSVADKKELHDKLEGHKREIHHHLGMINAHHGDASNTGWAGIEDHADAIRSHAIQLTHHSREAKSISDLLNR